MGTADSFPGGKAMGRELTTPFHLIPTLRVGGAIPLLPLYAYIACRGTFTFTFTHTNVGRDMDCRVRGSDLCGCEIFSARPDRPWGPLSSSYTMGTGVKAAGAWR